MALSEYKESQITSNINAGITRLRRFQSGDRFSYWPDSRHYRSSYSDWGALYASHFLTVVIKEGYTVPKKQLAHMRKFVKNQAKQVRTNHRYQCYALFLRALDGKADLGKMNLLKENYSTKLDPMSRELLATAYHLAGKESVAKTLIETKVEIKEYRELSGTFGSPARDMGMLTYLASIRGDEKRASEMMTRLSKQFRPGRWFATHETGISIIGLAKYAEKFGSTSEAVLYDITINGKREKGTLHEIQKQFALTDFDSKIIVKSESVAPLFVSLSLSGVPMDDRIVTESKGLQLERTMFTEEGYKIGLNDLKQGEPIWIVFNVKSEWSTKLENLALSMVLPAGWEIINRRLTGEGYPEWMGRVSEGTYSDTRDDRINWFMDLSRRQATKYAVKITRSFSGVYTLPPVVMETMYSPDYYARIKGGKTEVTKR